MSRLAGEGFPRYTRSGWFIISSEISRVLSFQRVKGLGKLEYVSYTLQLYHKVDLKCSIEFTKINNPNANWNGAKSSAVCPYNISFVN